MQECAHGFQQLNFRRRTHSHVTFTSVHALARIQTDTHPHTCCSWIQSLMQPSLTNTTAHTHTEVGYSQNHTGTPGARKPLKLLMSCRHERERPKVAFKVVLLFIVVYSPFSPCSHFLLPLSLWLRHLPLPSSSSSSPPSCPGFLCPLTRGSCVNVLSPRCVGLPLIVSLCCVVTTETLDKLQQLRLTHIQARTKHAHTEIRTNTDRHIDTHGQRVFQAQSLGEGLSGMLNI